MNANASNRKIPSGRPTTVTSRSTDAIGSRKNNAAPHPIDEPRRLRAASRTNGKSCGAKTRRSIPRISTEAEYATHHRNRPPKPISSNLNSVATLF